jgi:hypothetical protein
MKKHIKNLLNQIEKETPITLDYSNPKPTDKIFYTPNDPIDIDEIIMDGIMTLIVYSCGHKCCENITGIDIFYGHSSELSDAETAMNHIKKVAPNIPIHLFDELMLFRKPKR